MKKCSVIIVGEMNTDIVINDLPHFPKAGELVNGRELFIGPGGKSRNMAAMAGTLMPPGSVAMVSKTAKDKYGLWKEPLDNLQRTGVNTDFIQVTTSNLPGFAVILVDEQGTNQIIGAPGINRDFQPADVDLADVLFDEVSENHGYLALTGCIPQPTLAYAMRKARGKNIRTLFDPGGADDLSTLSPLLQDGIYVFKPNEHEAAVITGQAVTDFSSARQAAHILQGLGAENVLITAGKKGAYLFGGGIEKHIPVPDLNDNSVKDETGCGDQVMAALCASLHDNKSLEQAAEVAVRAGTLQFHKAGICPITSSELD